MKLKLFIVITLQLVMKFQANLGSLVYTSRNASIQGVLINHINVARHSVKACVFMLRSLGLIEALAEAHDRGVDVSVIIDKASVDRNLYIKILQSRDLLHVYDDNTGLMHNKFWTFDDREAITGSFNGTDAAENSHLENIIISYDQHVVRDYNGYFEYILTKITEQKIKKMFKQIQDDKKIRAVEDSLRKRRR